MPTKKVSHKHALQTIRQLEVHELWLSGYQVSKIASLTDLSIHQINTAIRKYRKQLYEENQASRQEHTEQSVAVLRRVEAMLWEQYYDTLDPKEEIKILSEIRKTEEGIARIRGLVSAKNINNVIKDLKLYNFKDNYPDKPKVVVNGMAEQVPDTEGTPASRARPEYEDDGVLALPDGDMVQLS